jgi:peptide/nickel transport system permease protein
LGAAVLWLAFGVGAGVLGSLRPNGWLDRALGAGMLAGVSLPVFVTAPIALLLLNFTWHVFPTVGYRSLLPNPLAWAGGLLLPWCVLAFSYAAMYARLTRAGMAEALREDYVRTARAKGLSERRVVLRHALRAAIMPVVTVFGMDLGMLLGGAVVAEQVFSLPGIGQATVLAVKEEDLPTVMGITLLAATFVIVANIVVDAGYTLLDPRVGRRAR